jgi:hypothetical protein
MSRLPLGLRLSRSSRLNGAVERIHRGPARGLKPGAVGTDGQRDVSVPEHAGNVVDVAPSLEVERRIGVAQAVRREPCREPGLPVLVLLARMWRPLSRETEDALDP